MTGPTEANGAAGAAGTAHDPDRLYKLLPAIYRIKDDALGQPLRALLRVIAGQVRVVEDDVARMYENWFIETCEDWVVPYLADLIGYTPVGGDGDAPPGGAAAANGAEGRGSLRARVLTPRREVANTLGYRRRKGTLGLLEQLVHDVAGWPARAVELGRSLAAMQALNHPWPTQGVRDDPRRTLDLRSGRALEQLGGPFESAARTPEVRRMTSGGSTGRHNPAAVALFVWRLEVFPVSCTSARPVWPRRDPDEVGVGYSFSVLGNDAPLYRRPAPEPAGQPWHIAGPDNLPVPITRREMEEAPATIMRRFADTPGQPQPPHASARYYGPGRSFSVWVEDWAGLKNEPIPNTRIIPADLTKWDYPVEFGRVAIDPTRGRILFPERQEPEGDVPVSVCYHYGFSAAMGGGEYRRAVSHPTGARVYVVRKPRRCTVGGAAPGGQAADADAARPAEYGTIYDALQAWQKDHPDQPVAGAASDAAPAAPAAYAVIEIRDSQLYNEQLDVRLAPGQSLKIAAAGGCRPAVHLVSGRAQTGDALCVAGPKPAADAKREGGGGKAPAARGGRPAVERTAGEFVLDGLLVFGSGVEITGLLDRVVVRHCTLVPGWDLRDGRREGRPDSARGGGSPDDDADDLPPDARGGAGAGRNRKRPREGAQQRGEEASLRLEATTAALSVERSIIGSIQVVQDERETDPLHVRIDDSIVDAAGRDLEAIGSPGRPAAHVRLWVRRSTIFGRVDVHSIELAQDSIFYGRLNVTRRQAGCVRFCYVPPGSGTPARYRCQPDAAMETAAAAASPATDPDAADRAREAAAQRVRPRFNSRSYGDPRYGQLADRCPDEIRRGAEDESEMGAFHDLFQPQRLANLATRLEEYTPAGASAAIVVES